MSSEDQKWHTELQAWLIKLETYRPGIALGLERVKIVGERLDLLHFSCPVVTVAGTNGKGSTVAALGALIGAAGVKLGIYTSPHLCDFNERISLNGEAVSCQTICEALGCIEKARQNIALTFFEFTTLAALLIFKTHNVELMILEVGMGGRLDAVNMISPTLAIITTIGFDHEDWLGNTLTKIGREKAGILRANIPVILGKTAAKCPSIRQLTNELNNEIHIEGKDFKPPLVFNYLPSTSVGLAIAAYTVLRKQLQLPSVLSIKEVLRNKTMLGRCQAVKLKNKTVVYDVGHNGQASCWLATRLAAFKEIKTWVAVWSSLGDKDLNAIVNPLKSAIKGWYIAPLAVNRGASVDQLKGSLNSCKVLEFEWIEKAFEAAFEDEACGILVFGSFYTVSTIWEYLGYKPRVKYGLL